MAEFKLEIVEGPDAGRQVELSGEPVEIGRDPSVGIELPADDLVSRRHARITPSRDGVTVEDLGSRNGTFVNGDEIYSPATLRPGDQVLVGVTVLQLHGPQEAVGATALRPVPAGLTAARPTPAPPAPEPEPEPDAAAARPPALAAAERRPDYVPDDLAAAPRRGGQLDSLLDVHTKSKARGAPLAIFVLVAIVVIIFLAVR
jgi:hypothetical protein